MMAIKIKILFLSAFLCGHTLLSQDQITYADYERAVGFMQENLVNKKVFNAFIEPHWFPDSTGFWYIYHSPEKKEFLQVALRSMTKSPLFDHEKLAVLLADSLEEEVDPFKLPISDIRYIGKDSLQLTLKDKLYILNVKAYTLSNPPQKATEDKLESLSPDSSWTAFTRDHNLFIRSNTTDEIKQLSHEGKKGYEYASWYGWDDIMEGENGDRPERFSVNWSKDGQWIQTYICDLRNADKMYLLDWSIDSLYRPRLLSYYRGSPGDTTMVYMEPVFFHVATGKEIKTGLPIGTHINTTSVTWSETPGKVYLYQQSRGYQQIRIYAFNLETEILDTLYTETSETNIDNFTFELEEKSGSLFYLSEKSGWRQLYRLDLKSGKAKMLTGDGYYINSIEYIDATEKKIFFTASGKDQVKDPYQQQLFSISMNGKGLTLLTPEDRHHRVSFSPDGNYVVDNYSAINIPTQTVLSEARSGSTLLTLGEAILKDIEAWQAPEVFTALARDGVTTIYGQIWKPTHFDPSKKYPVIELSYTGPHTHMFQSSFDRAFMLQPYAELGFVALVVDGLGSSGRSKAFHNYSYKNLGGNLEDHVLAIRELGKRYQWIDTTRVGIFGHSAGGYDAAHALLAYPDFYKVGVASSADHDHRMEKAWWPEMYMGWPVDTAYHLQSNITMAGNLKGKLLVTHGGIDENVNPSATFKLAEALIRADKQFDMLILPSQHHGYRGAHSRYFTKLRWNYFIEHLGGNEPLWDFKWE